MQTVINSHICVAHNSWALVLHHQYAVRHFEKLPQYLTQIKNHAATTKTTFEYT